MVMPTNTVVKNYKHGSNFGTFFKNVLIGMLYPTPLSKEKVSKCRSIS